MKRSDTTGIFQLTPSRRATFAYNPRQQLWHISTHALTEGDPVRHILLSHCNDFNSRPHGGRLRPINFSPCSIYFNSRPHGGRPVPYFFTPHFIFISTHALTEGDITNKSFRIFRRISTHALTEGDFGLTILLETNIFQLTPSRRATANLDKFFF